MVWSMLMHIGHSCQLSCRAVISDLLYSGVRYATWTLKCLEMENTEVYGSDNAMVEILRISIIDIIDPL